MSTADREIATTRVVEALRERVTIKVFGAVEGAKQMLERLTQHAAKMERGERS